MRRINNASEELVEYMLFSERPRLPSLFAGLQDSRRSLRKALLMTAKADRFETWISTAAFSAIRAATDLLGSLRQDARCGAGTHSPAVWDVLKGKDTTAAFKHLSAADRQNIFEILTETKKNLPSWWQS